MIKQYFKQAFYQLKENKLISVVSIIGTALAICMIMVIVLIIQVRVTDCVPEVNRSRSLYMKAMSIRQKGDESGFSSNGAMSVTTAKECFKALTIPEVVTVTSISSKVRLSLPTGNVTGAFEKMETDEDFWRVFDFSFISGKPYTKADCESGLTKVVVSASVARKLFGTTDVAGRAIQLNHAEYTITGVVKDVSKLATASYAQVWIPYNSTDLPKLAWYDNAMGTFRVVILARTRDDFAAIREEVEKLRLKYNAGLRDSEVFYRGQPDDQFAYIYRHWGEETSGAKEAYMRYVLVIVILLLVPAINLSSMTLSRMRKRMAEIGVRKAFGATANELLRQVFFENLILTLLAGVVGLAFSYVSTFLLGGFLFSNSENMEQLGATDLAADMVLSPVVFLAAFVFCFVLNLLSACIPAWRASRLNIMDALNQR